MKAIKDFGFVVLELLPAEPQDTGTWECVASNVSLKMELKFMLNMVKHL